MGSQRLSLALTIVNLVVLALVVANVTGFPAPAAATVGEASPARHQEVAAVLRGRELELVDRNGRVRSRLNVEPNGDVVLRLIDQNGTIRVKLGAGEGGSGLLLIDETTEPAVHMVARRAGTPETPTTTSITLRGADGQREIRPPDP